MDSPLWTWATNRAMRSPTSSTRWTSRLRPAPSWICSTRFGRIAEKLKDVTDLICDHIASVYQENSPQRIYFLMLFSIFSEFLEDVSEDVLPNERTGYQDSAIWQKLYNFQRDAATGHHQQAGNLQRLHPGRQRRTGKDVHRSRRHQVLRTPQPLRPRPLPQEARRQLDQLQRQPEEQPAREGPLQLRRALPHRPASRPWRIPRACR